jgi:serine/threonine-protein kinase
MDGPASDVFISYKAEDRKRLTPLVKALEDEGFDVWWDQHIGSGTDWREEIETHLDAAKVVIVVWSKKTIGAEGRFVRDEAGQAQEAGHYLPITVDNVRPPLGFREVQALDLSSWKGNRADPRFQVLADTIRHRLAGKEIGRKALVVGNAPVSRRGVMIGGGAATAAVAAGLVGWELLRPSAANARRIAVMPFDNLSGDPNQAYFSDGIAEELRSALARIGLEVIGRASSDAVKDMDTKAAAAKLGVANVLTGSVRRSLETIRIDAQLIGGSDGVERWTQSYDRAPGDAIKIQTDIATNVAQALSVALGQAARAAVTLGGTADSAAQDLYLKASALRGTADSEEVVRQVLGLSNAALARDPNYADAHVLRALVLVNLAGRYANTPAEVASTLQQAAAAANRAIGLAPGLGYAYAELGYIEQYRLNFAAALQKVRQALSLSPDDPNVIRAAANVVPLLGSPQEALRLGDRVVALDPLAPRAIASRAIIFKILRRYPDAIDAARKALQLAPQLSGARVSLGYSLTLMNRSAEADAEYQKLPADDTFRLAGEAILAARSRDLAGAEKVMAHLRALDGATASYQYAEIYAQAGNADRAFAELGNAVEAKDPGLAQLKTDAFFDPIRGDPRFAALLKQLNFP